MLVSKNGSCFGVSLSVSASLLPLARFPALCDPERQRQENCGHEGHRVRGQGEQKQLQPQQPQLIHWKYNSSAACIYSLTQAVECFIVICMAKTITPPPMHNSSNCVIIAFPSLILCVMKELKPNFTLKH